MLEECSFNDEVDLLHYIGAHREDIREKLQLNFEIIMSENEGAALTSFAKLDDFFANFKNYYSGKGLVKEHICLLETEDDGFRESVQIPSEIGKLSVSPEKSEGNRDSAYISFASSFGPCSKPAAPAKDAFSLTTDVAGGILFSLNSSD
jgi:hypothetical protein